MTTVIRGLKQWLKEHLTPSGGKASNVVHPHDGNLRGRPASSQSSAPRQQLPVYYDKPYYLGPDKGGAKPYRLLAEVMKETGRVALAKYAARGKQYLVMLRPSGEGIVMQQLLYADEVRAFSEVPLEPAEVSSKELDLAKLLVDQRAVESFKPETYEDDVKKRVLGLIQKKV